MILRKIASSLPCERVVEEVGLGGSEQDTLDPPAKQPRGKRVGAQPETVEHIGERELEVEDCRRSGVDGGQRIHQHDLAVEPGEMAEEKRFHHMAHIGVVAALHQIGERARREDCCRLRCRAARR